MKQFILVLLFFNAFIINAQPNPQKPCSLPEASQFDFWVGDWTLTWNDSLHGSNRIEKMFGNCTVHENFSDPKMGYLGQSWTVYNANYKKWEQTWVDNQGGYIALTGGKVGDSLILTTAEQTVPLKLSASGKLISRMVFYNIKINSFDWCWESSTNNGSTWTPNWQIKYSRK